MEAAYKALLLDSARTYIESIPSADAATIAADIQWMESGDFKTPKIKSLKAHLKELISGHHRLTFFVHQRGIYFVRGFRKKSGKTPKVEITYAEKIYKKIQTMK